MGINSGGSGELKCVFWLSWKRNGRHSSSFIDESWTAYFYCRRSFHLTIGNIFFHVDRHIRDPSRPTMYRFYHSHRPKKLYSTVSSDSFKKVAFFVLHVNRLSCIAMELEISFSHQVRSIRASKCSSQLNASQIRIETGVE